jgi:orotidine-5'-phosphate decarboxylase
MTEIAIALGNLSFVGCLDLVCKTSRAYAHKCNLGHLLKYRGFQFDLKNAGAKRIFIDAKVFEITSEAANIARDAAKNGIDILTVHAAGGIEMMRAVVESGPREIYAVTVLTSERAVTGRDGVSSTEDLVLSRALDAAEAGVHGIVCSPQEAAILRSRSEMQGIKLVTPGIRPIGSEAFDQKRIATPREAVEAGSDVLVIGRPITMAADPHAAYREIVAEIRNTTTTETR